MPVRLGHLGQGSPGIHQGIGMAGLGLVTNLRDSEAANPSCGLWQPSLFLSLARAASREGRL